MLIELLIAFFVGALVGCLLISVLLRPKVGGIINIDRSDPDGPYLFLELNESVSELSTKEYVKFTVKNKNYISSK